MNKIAKILNVFFVSLGVIFFIILIIASYIIIADPFNIKAFFNNSKLPVSFPSMLNTTSSNDNHPLLTPEQENTLEKLGINPASLPTQITPEMEGCFIEKLGQARVNEIMQGSEPSAFDFIKAGSCINN